MLLRFGAYAIMDDDNKASDTFCEADIDTILGGAKVVTYALPKVGPDGQPIEGEEAAAVSVFMCDVCTSYGCATFMLFSMYRDACFLLCVCVCLGVCVCACVCRFS
jgi:hypothetical protein